MKNIEQIATDMRCLAQEIGGEHHTFKESERLLKELADELSNVNMEFSLKIHELFDKDDVYTGITDNARFDERKQRNINSNS